MKEKTDLRIIKTKKSLYEALETLMKETPFEDIKVSDICANALVNRSTFYSHYEDKYELLNEYITSLKDLLIEALSKNNNIKNTKGYYMEMLTILLDYLEKKKDDYRLIMVNNKNSIVIDILHNVINRYVIDHMNIEKSEVPSDIIFEFYAGAIFNVCTDWIGSNKYSKEEILGYFNTLLPSDLK